MSKYIDTDLLVNLITTSVEVIEGEIDSADPQFMMGIRANMEEGIAAGAVDPEARNFSDSEILAGMAIIEMASQMVKHAHDLLVNPNVVRRVRREGGAVIIDERKLTDAEISVNAAMGIADLEAFVSNINRPKE